MVSAFHKAKTEYYRAIVRFNKSFEMLEALPRHKRTATKSRDIHVRYGEDLTKILDKLIGRP